MSDKTKHTGGPWAWNEVGGHWVLWGSYGQRPAVLCVTPDGQLQVRDRLGFLVPFTPEHPDALLIEVAPDLLEALVATEAYMAERGVSRESPAMSNARAIIAKATGQEATA